MAVARKTEVIASSTKSFQAATDLAVERASATLRGITGLEVIAQKAKVEDGKIVEYRVECAITFILDE